MDDSRKYIIKKLKQLAATEAIRFNALTETGKMLENGFSPSIPHFEYVLSGQLPILTPSSESIKTKGDFIYVKPGAFIGRRDNTERQLLVINLYDDGIECYRSHRKADFATNHRKRISTYSSLPLSPGGHHILKAFEYYLLQNNTELSQQLLASFLHSIIDNFLNETQEKKTKPHTTFRMILQYMKENCHSPIDRQTIATEFGISEDYISHLFQAHHSASFNLTLTRLKMEKASLMLTQTNQTVAQIAKQLSYPETSYFIKVFRNYFGLTPGKYRDKVKR